MMNRIGRDTEPCANPLITVIHLEVFTYNNNPLLPLSQPVHNLVDGAFVTG